MAEEYSLEAAEELAKELIGKWQEDSVIVLYKEGKYYALSPPVWRREGVPIGFRIAKIVYAKGKSPAELRKEPDPWKPISPEKLLEMVGVRQVEIPGHTRRYPEVEKPCANCGNLYKGNPLSRYCSKKCAKKAANSRFYQAQ